MKLINTKTNLRSTFKNAILNPSSYGQWFFPYIPQVSNKFMKELPYYSFNDIAYKISKYYNLNHELGDNNLQDIIEKSFDFPIIDTKIHNNLSMCELYHGKSKSFKDIGTSFTANIINYINKTDNLKIITATTGDTGSAVASAFHNKPGIDVYILYPKNRISKIQRKQMTTYGNNIKCIEVNSNFDECQNIVKKILQDKDIKNITTCNSINIGRILGQLFYYFYICRKYLDKDINISIPTGNLGSGLSCYISKEMGLPINNIIYACNVNSNLPDLMNNKKLDINKFSKKTYSNAIDIINPSNYERLDFLQNKNNIITNISSDYDTHYMIKYINYKYSIKIDPHTAVAFNGLYKNGLNLYDKSEHNIVMSTADPVKFYDILENIIDIKIPKDIKNIMDKEEHIIYCENEYDEIKFEILK